MTSERAEEIGSWSCACGVEGVGLDTAFEHQKECGFVAHWAEQASSVEHRTSWCSCHGYCCVPSCPAPEPHHEGRGGPWSKS